MTANGVTVEFKVDGVPIPQGSKTLARAGGVASGRPLLVDDNRGLKPWREAVAWHARGAMAGRRPFTGVVSLGVEFTLPRPKSVLRDRPVVRPDLDKLLRAVMDALTIGGVWVDDAQVCDISTGKRYPALGKFSAPGALIWVRGAV